MNDAMVTSGYELPERYHKDLLRLMVRDAHSLYVYWEISNRRRWLVSQHFECDWGIMPKVLRIYDVTGIYFNGNNAHSRTDIEVTPDADNWYVHGVHANATYIADFGTYNLHRQFIPLLRSNAAMTPRDGKAAHGEPIVATVPEVRGGATPQRIPPHEFENFAVYRATPPV